jgi:hypothetical protein
LPSLLISAIPPAALALDKYSVVVKNSGVAETNGQQS